MPWAYSKKGPRKGVRIVKAQGGKRTAQVLEFQKKKRRGSTTTLQKVLDQLDDKAGGR